MFFKREKPIIFIDMDDTIADTRRGVVKLYSQITGQSAKDIKLKTKEYADLCPQLTKEQVDNLFAIGIQLYDLVEPMVGAQKAISALSAKGYDIRIVTLSNPGCAEAKHKWIEKYFPKLKDKVYYIDYRIDNKDIFCGYSIIDDDKKNIVNNKSSIPVLLDFYNIYQEEKGYNKCSTWEQVILKF